MFKITHTKLLFNFLMLFALAIGFYACQQNDSFTNEETEKHVSLFDQHLIDNTQNITAQDLGNGQYEVTGEQGTRISINNALVNSAGEKVRGAVDMVLVEIYTQTDMILNKKQTIANDNGQLRFLESGGEIYLKIYQDGEELSIDEDETVNLYLPTENTGGAKKGMELFYGEEIGEQLIWTPTGIAIKVVNSESRNGSEYEALLQNLGWANVDLYTGNGDPVECLEVAIECEFCEGATINVAIHVGSTNAAAQLVYDSNTGTYRLCSQQGGFPLGGMQVTFIVVVECPDGSPAFVAFVNTTVNPGFHSEVVFCENFQQMDPGQFADALNNL